MAIQANFPALKPTLLLDFANAEQLDPRITFTRASTATYYGTQTAMAEQNLLTRSQELGVGAWATTNGTITANSIAAPDGTTTADTLIDDATSGAHFCSQVVTMTAGIVYTQSFFLKASTNNFAIVTLSSSVTNNYISAVVNLSTGAITQTGTGTSATFTSSSITSVGNGWYRVVITGSTTGGFTRAEVGLAPAATGNSFATNGRITYAGTGTSIFVWGAQLEQRSAATAYTATTAEPITNYIPQLLTAASGVARFDHNPITFESLGLLIEESRTNLLTYSEQFNDAAWTKSRASITANAAVSPDGALTGDKLVEDNTAGSHTVRNATSVTITSGTTLTASVFAKAAEGAFVIVGIGDGGGVNISRATFDLSNNSVSGLITAPANVSAPIPVITPVGNGWYRCVVTATVTGVTTAQQWVFKGANSNGTASYAGDGYSGIFIWGAQLEVGAFATSYIPTVASQVTRAADAASMTGTNFSSWYNAGEGAMYAEAIAPNSGTSVGIVELNNSAAAASNYVTVYRQGATWRYRTNAVNLNLSPALTEGSFNKVSFGYSATSYPISVNGTTAQTNTTTGLASGVNQMLIGFTSVTASPLNGTIKKIAYYPLRVTNAQLQALTS